MDNNIDLEQSCDINNIRHVEPLKHGSNGGSSRQLERTVPTAGTADSRIFTVARTTG